MHTKSFSYGGQVVFGGHVTGGGHIVGGGGVGHIFGL